MPTLIHRVSGASVLGEEAWAVVEGRGSGLLRGEIVELAGGRSVLAPLLKSKSVNRNITRHLEEGRRRGGGTGAMENVHCTSEDDR